MAATVPTFSVIGTMKGGTSSLHRYLEMHPEVTMTAEKECNFFIPVKGGGYRRGFDWYRSLFQEEAKAYGDVSPDYTKRHRFSDEVPRLICEANPDVRLLYLLRDPIDRFVSGYIHNTARGRVRRSFSQFIRSPQAEPHLLTSSYHYQLEPYLQHFSLDQFLFPTSEELRQSTAEVLQRIFEFIGVSAFESEGFEKQYHVSAGKTRPSVLEERVKSPRARRLLGRVLPESVTARRPIERPQLSDEDRAYLVERLGPEVEKLRAVTGLPFDGWSL